MIVVSTTISLLSCSVASLFSYETIFEMTSSDKGEFLRFVGMGLASGLLFGFFSSWHKEQNTFRLTLDTR